MFRLHDGVWRGGIVLFLNRAHSNINTFQFSLSQLWIVGYCSYTYLFIQMAAQKFRLEATLANRFQLFFVSAGLSTFGADENEFFRIFVLRGSAGEIIPEIASSEACQNFQVHVGSAFDYGDSSELSPLTEKVNKTAVESEEALDLSLENSTSLELEDKPENKSSAMLEEKLPKKLPEVTNPAETFSDEFLEDLAPETDASTEAPGSASRCSVLPYFLVSLSFSLYFM